MSHPDGFSLQPPSTDIWPLYPAEGEQQKVIDENFLGLLDMKKRNGMF